MARLFLSFLAVALTACVHAPKRTALHYSAPSAAPVRSAIATAQTSISKAQTHAVAVRAKIVEAEAAAPSPLLASAVQETDALTAELLGAQTALEQSQARVTELEVKFSAQTETLNTTIDAKNAALDLVAITEKKRAAAVKQRNQFFAVITAAAAWIFRGPLLALCKIVIGLCLRVIKPI